jgi:HSP20 family protein
MKGESNMTANTLEKRPAAEAPERLNNEAWYNPAADVMEDHDGFTLLFDMPGVHPQDTDITFADGVLTVEGKLATIEDAGSRNYLVREYGTGHFHRSFTIRTPIDSEGIRGDLKNGELTIRIPKAETAKVRKIVVHGG